MTFARLDVPDALDFTEFHSDLFCRKVLWWVPSRLDLRARSPILADLENTAIYITSPAISGLLNATVQSFFLPEVICSKSTLWVPLLLLKLLTLITRPPDLQLKRAARR